MQRVTNQLRQQFEEHSYLLTSTKFVDYRERILSQHLFYASFVLPPKVLAKFRGVEGILEDKVDY